MTTFAGVKAQKYHFDSCIRWFEFIEDSATVKARNKGYDYNCTVLPVSDSDQLRARIFYSERRLLIKYYYKLVLLTPVSFSTVNYANL